MRGNTECPRCSFCNGYIIFPITYEDPIGTLIHLEIGKQGIKEFDFALEIAGLNIMRNQITIVVKVILARTKTIFDIKVVFCSSDKILKSARNKYRYKFVGLRVSN